MRPHAAAEIPFAASFRLRKVLFSISLFGRSAPGGLFLLRLTAYTNYALRVLMYCALHPDRTVRTQDVSDAYGISKAHLLKAARQLGQLGYLTNIRGRTGGIKLGMKPDKINVGEVVRHTEDDGSFVECFNASENTCPLLGVCKLSQLFKTGLRAFYAELDKVSLADITKNAPALLDRLKPAAARARIK